MQRLLRNEEPAGFSFVSTGHQDAAAGAGGDRFTSGAGGGLRDALRRRPRGDAQFLGAALYPDRARAFGARHAAVQPHGILLGDADRAPLQQADAPAGRPLRLHAVHRRAAVARLCRAQRLERGSGPDRARSVRHRAGVAGQAAIQRPRHLLAEGACRRCRAKSSRRSISTASTSSATTRLQSAMERTTATPEKIAEAVRVNADGRLRASPPRNLDSNRKRRSTS
jgi:hypothetical protein